MPLAFFFSGVGFGFLPAGGGGGGRLDQQEVPATTVVCELLSVYRALHAAHKMLANEEIRNTAA